MAKQNVTGVTATPGSRARGETRALLMDAGLDLFARRGFAAVSVGELEKAVGLKPGCGAFYRHFPDKEALLKAILDSEIERAGQRLAEEMHLFEIASVDIRVVLAEQFKTTLRAYREGAKLINLLIRGADSFPDLKLQLFNSMTFKGMQRIARAYELRMRSGEMINTDPLAAAAVVHCALHGYGSLEWLFGVRPRSEQEEAVLIQTLVDMLVPQSSARQGASEPTGKSSGKSAGKSPAESSRRPTRSR